MRIRISRSGVYPGTGVEHLWTASLCCHRPLNDVVAAVIEREGGCGIRAVTSRGVTRGIEKRRAGVGGIIDGQCRPLQTHVDGALRRKAVRKRVVAIDIATAVGDKPGGVTDGAGRETADLAQREPGRQRGPRV